MTDAGTSAATSGSNDSGSSTASSPNDAATSAPTLAVTGTLNSAAFAASSGFFYLNDDATIDLVFSDRAGLCDSVVGGKLRAGETLVLLPGIAATKPGTYTSVDDENYAYSIVKPSCAPGTTLSDDQFAASSDVQSSSVTITEKTATTLVGTLTITFLDGSKATGSFSLAACSATLPSPGVCS